MKPIKSILLSKICLCTPIFLATGVHALTIDPDQAAASLASELFLNAPGFSNIVATSSGNVTQFGTFENDRATYGLPARGIVLSTGNVADYGDGPNDNGGNTTGFDSPATPSQEALLDPITGGDFSHNDVAQLTITFEAGADVDSITFFGTFGSEEFPEFVGSEFIDGFGLFVNGQNVAFAAGEPINIDHPDFLGATPINDGEGGPGDGGPIFDDEFLAQNVEFEGELPVGGPVAVSTVFEPGDPRLALLTGTELDGVIAPGGNPVLRFDVPVVAGQSNTFDIIIADTSDDVLDSTVFLSSFQPTEIDLNDGSTEFTPLLPNDPDPNNGVFQFDLAEIEELGEIFFIDPPVAIGYTYTVADAAFSKIQAPSLATINDIDGYSIQIGATMIDLAPGQVVDLVALGLTDVNAFTLTGIDEVLMLDPDNPLAFPLGVALTDVFGPTPSITQAALTVDTDGPSPSPVPVPASLPLILGAFTVMCFAGRRQRKS